jgi:hypothetical protein
VVIPQSNERLIQVCRAQGLTVLAPDVSMISNGGGSLHCMCQGLRRDPV